MTIKRPEFFDVFPKRPIIGTVHLKALPGSPAYDNDLAATIEAALHDAEVYEWGGCAALIVENFFDAPFLKDQVGPETIAAMARVATLIRQKTKLPLGINVLRNDAISAMAIAAACDCQFIRVNVLAWAMLTDQGVIEGKSAQLLRFRAQLQANVLVLADCLVKHAVPLAPQSMEFVAMDTWERGGADALIISGVGTGKATDEGEVRQARKGAPDAPLLIGSGVNEANVGSLLTVADGAIVGTSFKVDGKIDNPVELARVQRLVALARK